MPFPGGAFCALSVLFLPIEIPLPEHQAPEAVLKMKPVTMRWRSLARGAEYARITVEPGLAIGDNRLHLLRVDPRRARLVVGIAALHDGRRTARAWLKKLRLRAAINLGMYARDLSRHASYLRVGGHVSNPRWRPEYHSALLLRPRRSGLPRATIVDLDAPGAKALAGRYRIVVQNIRMIRAGPDGRGVNVWRDKPRRWSEAALAQDTRGRLLFIFCRTPFKLHRLSHTLLRIPLQVVRAMHLEGGPAASLSIRARGLRLDLNGSFVTRYNENDAIRRQKRVPNVLGIAR